MEASDRLLHEAAFFERGKSDTLQESSNLRSFEGAFFRTRKGLVDRAARRAACFTRPRSFNAEAYQGDRTYIRWT